WMLPFLVELLGKGFVISAVARHQYPLPPAPSVRWPSCMMPWVIPHKWRYDPSGVRLTRQAADVLTGKHKRTAATRRLDAQEIPADTPATCAEIAPPSRHRRAVLFTSWKKGKGRQGDCEPFYRPQVEQIISQSQEK